jgi:hypothetical protein
VANDRRNDEYGNDWRRAPMTEGLAVGLALLVRNLGLMLLPTVDLGRNYELPEE